MEATKKVIIKEITTFDEVVNDAFKQLDIEKAIKNEKKIIIKPNLVFNSSPPITTDVRLVTAIARYCLKNSSAEVMVAEGSASIDTEIPFRDQGYYESLEPMGVKVINSDKEPIVTLTNPKLSLYKEIFLPKIIIDGFLISVPALKEHNLTTVTLSLKNLIGFLPASKYHAYWRFRKSLAHRYNIHQVVADLNIYRPINLAVIDGSIGQKRGHLFGGKPCEPPKNIIIASHNPLAADIEGAKILGKRPIKVKHFRCYKNNLKNERLAN